MHHACAVLNFTIDDIFDQCLKTFFTMTFLQLTDQSNVYAQLVQTKSQRESFLHRHLQHNYIIQNLLRLKSEPTFGILLKQAHNITNVCIIKSINMVS